MDVENMNTEELNRVTSDESKEQSETQQLIDMNTIAESLSKNRRRKYPLLQIIVAVLVLLLIILGAAKIATGRSKKVGNDAGSELTIGVILPLSGTNEAIGTAQRAAYELAASDVNGYLTDIGNAKRIKLEFSDNKSQDKTSIKLVKAMLQTGKYYISGSLNNNEIKALLSNFKDKDAILISQTSNSSEMAIENDGIYRFYIPAESISKESTGKQSEIKSQLKERTGNDPPIESLTAYDTIWAIGLSFLSNDNKAEARKTFEDIAATYVGVTGLLQLDKNGDRIIHQQ
jgi:ABC-type branched-subunit amino acid transport system substrate-binding protein